MFSDYGWFVAPSSSHVLILHTTKSDDCLSVQVERRRQSNSLESNVIVITLLHYTVMKQSKALLYRKNRLLLEFNF